MGSTRSNAGKRRAARAAASETPKRAFTVLARRAARIQTAVFSAAAKTLTGVPQSADRLAQALGNVLLRGLDGETDSAELVADVTAATRLHLRALTGLPRASADHFDARLAHRSTTGRSR